MSDKLENALSEAIEKVNSGIDTATEFLVSELPDVIQQALTWNLVEHAVWGAVFVFISVVFSFGLVKSVAFWKKMNQAYKDGDDIAFFSNHKLSTSSAYDGRFVPALASVLALLISSSIAISNFMVSLKILIAPKLWLIEYAAKLAS